jgi:hypothetical protein
MPGGDIMTPDTDFIDDAEKRFLGRVAGQEKKLASGRKAASEISSIKSQKLVPLRKLLLRFVDRGIVVSHCERDSVASRRPAQAFLVYENESSPRFLPGVSIYFDHPAQVEIAIPNDSDIGTLGEVVICCATPHPDSPMLQGPFRSMRDAALALADFLARNTISIDRSEKPDEA